MRRVSVIANWLGNNMDAQVNVPEDRQVLTTALHTRLADSPRAIPVWRRVLRDGEVVGKWRKYGICKDASDSRIHVGKLPVDKMGAQPGDVVQVFTDFDAVTKIEMKWDA